MAPARVAVLFAGTLATASLAGAESFVNWESPHVHPLDLTPDHTRLLAVNTADDRLEVFDVRDGTPLLSASIPVGLDPVSVRARSDTEAWVVNHVSDSVSIVDLVSGRVVRTLDTADEPCDVVFAGSVERAFVSCSQANQILVFDPGNLAAAPVVVPLDAEDPRALAVSPDRQTVYAAIFESGNGSTILGGGAADPDFFPPNAVSDPAGPYGGINPPPNSGSSFDPPQNPQNPPPPPVGLIVKRDGAGAWLDDNGGDWTALTSGPLAAKSGRPVGWTLLDHDLARVDTATLAVSYTGGLMNLNMAAAVNPATAQVGVVGTDATNEVRFEPQLNGRFLRVQLALVSPSPLNPPAVLDLNPQLTYATPSVPQGVRDLAIGDPRGLVWNAAGTLGYVAGMGSDNVVEVDGAGSRTGAPQPIGVGQGPTGLALDELRARLYVLNKFEASISAVDTGLRAELARVAFHDPTPPTVRAGRRHLYDTQETSGLGHVSCASCHPDARMDRLAWDLGNPAGEMKSFEGNCNFGSPVLGPGPCDDWHPMKGPMVTQTLQDIIGKEPHHWRGDRTGIEQFNQTFMNLQGDDELLTAGEMQELENFLSSLTLPPNPFRNFDNSLPTLLPLTGHYYAGVGGPTGQPLPPGSAVKGSSDFRNHHIIEGFAASCNHCHSLPSGVGTNQDLSQGGAELPPGPDGELHHGVVETSLSETPNHSIKVPHLRNLYEKVGFEMTQETSRSGFGFLHDGSVDSLARFMSNPPFRFDIPIDGTPQQRLVGMVAFMLAFSGSDLPRPSGIPIDVEGPLSKDTHTAVGTELTVDGANKTDGAVVALLGSMTGVADKAPDTATPNPMAALVARGRQNGLARGFTYAGSGIFQSDRASQAIGTDALRLAAGTGSEITFTVVPRGSEVRIGIDRDEDGAYDRDELDACSDPTDAADVPDDDVSSPRLVMDRSGAELVLSWNPIGTSYDVVVGSLDVLRASGGDFTAAVLACAVDDATLASLLLADPLPLESLFFLVRASCIGGATYDSGGPAQSGFRDNEVEASPFACPD